MKNIKQAKTFFSP